MGIHDLVLDRLNWRFSIFDLFSIHALIVTDSADASYGPAEGASQPFSLQELVRALTHPAGGAPWIRVTKAHRQLDPNGTGSGAGRVTPADIENFQFSAASLAPYHQVWLIGVDDFGMLPEPEVQALMHFMNAGGGVFATGDHADLGVTLSGGVPRLRSMRKWFLSGGPHGEPAAPDPLNANRLDTTRAHPANQFPFDNQSDDIPMTVRPTWYSWGIFRYPHPLLCGHQGAITVMPDHMHEGEVITPDGTDPVSGWTGSGVPGGLGTTLTVNGENFVEYPSLNGHQERPVIVSQADVIGGHTTPSTEYHTGATTPVNARSFANIGAYDGLRVGVGRVVVDSTWHHFFDINLIGDPTAPAPKNQGFHASAAGQAALAKIDNYFVNIATWLSPGRGYFLLGGLLAAMRSAEAVELMPLFRKPRAAEDMLRVGDYVYGGLRRYLPPCSVLNIVLNEYYEMQPIFKLPDPPDPWKQREGGDPARYSIDPTGWAVAALGGMAAEVFGALHREEKLDLPHARRAMQQGLLKGLQAFAHRNAKQARELLKASEEMLDCMAAGERLNTR